MTNPSMIAIDWGSTSARASLLDPQGASIDTCSAMLGVKNISRNGFDNALQNLCGTWLSAHPNLPVFASGMIGSRQGWREAPYVTCPVSLSLLAQDTVVVETGSGRLMHIVPGARYTDPDGLDDVMRGEETQVFGVLTTDAAEKKLLILPGTHSKWVLVEDRKISRFTTFVTGELFDVLNTYSLLGQYGSNDEVVDSEAPEFIYGIERAFAARSEGAGMLSQLFSVRTRRLIAGISGAEAKKYMSGLLIGSEISEGIAILSKQGISLRHVTLVGDPRLCALYQPGLTRCGFTCDIYPFSAAVQGLWAVANQSAILERQHA